MSTFPSQDPIAYRKDLRKEMGLEEDQNAKKKSNPLNESVKNIDTISQSNIPSIKKILVTYDGKDKSEKAINYSIYLANISKAELIILEVIENIDKFENTTVDVSDRILSNNNTESTSTSGNISGSVDQDNSVSVEGHVIESMEEKLRTIKDVGLENKASFRIRTGSAVEEIVKEINGSHYDLLVLSTSHLDSWVKSLFSDTRKIISNINTPVLLLQ
jgi:nucleotide-binding universal stress UspA family protein